MNLVDNFDCVAKLGVFSQVSRGGEGLEVICHKTCLCLTFSNLLLNLYGFITGRALFTVTELGLNRFFIHPFVSKVCIHTDLSR